MKRMMIATALATTIGTAAFAATEGQIQQVQTFNSGIDTSTFSDSDYDVAYGIVTSGMSHGEKSAELRAMATDDSGDTGIANISEAEMAQLQQYTPDANFDAITQSQAEAALAVTYSGESPSEITRRVQNILNGAEMDADTMAAISAGQESMLRTYVPNADLSDLTKDELLLAMSYVHSGMSRSETSAQIKALIN